MPSPMSAFPITVNLGNPLLVSIISGLNQDLARSCQRQLTITIVNQPRNERERRARRITEGVAVQAIFQLLTVDFGRIQTLLIQTDLRSSLRGVPELVQRLDHGSLEKFKMRSNVDDVSSAPA